MTFSKNALNLLLLTTLLVSCSQGIENKKIDELGQASSNLSESPGIYADKLSLKYVQQRGETATSRQVSDKFYTIEACIKTNIKRDLEKTSFEVSGTDFETQLITSDYQTCITWQEHIELDYTMANSIVKFSRDIKLANTNFKVKVNFGIDPLNGDTFLDLSKAKSIAYTDEANNKALAEDDRIIMDQIRFTPKGYGKDDPRNDNNIIDKPFVANTCFQIKSTGQKMARQKIDAFMINEETGRVLEKRNFVLNENGCAELSFAMLHERYTNTRRVPYNFIVRAKDPSLKGAFTQRQVCLYPWSNSGWVFGHDTISGNCPEDSKDAKAKIFLDEINYTFLGHDNENGFHINKDLDLVIVKSYVVNMFPKIDYGNFVHVIDSTEPIFSGRFRLKVILLAPTEGDIELTPSNYHKFKIISATSKEVEIEAKRLKARIDLPIKFSDVPYVYTRTYAVVKLEPLEENDYSLVPGIAAGTFHASSKMFRSILHTQVNTDDVITKETTSMKELQGFLNNLFTQIKDNSFKEIINHQLTRKVQQTTKEKLTQELGKDEKKYAETHLNEISFNKLLTEKLTNDEINELFEDKYTYSVMQKLCSMFFDSTKSKFLFTTSYKDISYQRCLERPETMMNFNALSIIKSIDTTPVIDFSNTIRLHGGAGSGSYHGESDRVATSRGIKAGVGVKFDIPIVKVGVNGGMEIGKAWAHDTSTGNSNRADIGSGIDLYAEKLTLKFDATTQQCLIIDGTIKYEQKIEMPAVNTMNAPAPRLVEFAVPNLKRFRICKSKMATENLKESWFYIGEGHQFNTILRDGLNMAENKYVTLMRGEKNMADFINFMHSNHDKTFRKKVKNHILPDTYMKDTFSSFSQAFDKDKDLVSDAATPGILTKYSDLGNADDQYYEELPEENFDPISGKMLNSNRGK